MSEMTNDEKAETIIKSWFWQMSESHSFRWSKAVKSMTLFYESAPMSSDIAQLVVQYLKTREGVTDFIINHKKWHFDAPGWNAKEASYVTAPGEKWNGTESTKVRIYWTLVQAGDGTADGPYVVENGCKYRVTHEYYWDVAAQPTLPPSTSGVQYSIQGFTRDKETGLYTYIIEERETVQQDIALYESQKTIFETVSEEQHLGVKQNLVPGTGLQASVVNGVLIERTLSKNPDCTTDIRNRKIEEKKVEESRTVQRKTLRGVSAAVTHRNLTPAESTAKTPRPIDFGETRTVEKTPGDKRNLTVETFEAGELPLVVAKSCEKTRASETDTTVTAVNVESIVDPHPQIPETNKRKSVSFRKNEDGKTADKTEVVETRQEQSAAGGGTQGTAAATTTQRVQDGTTQLVTPPAAVNTVVEVDNQPNGMGGFNSVKRTTTHETKTATGRGASGPASSTTTERVQNGTAEMAGGGSAAVNTVVEVDNAPNGMGGFNSTKRTTKHETQFAAGGGSQGGVVSTTTERVQNGTSELIVTGAGVNQVVEVDNTPNGMGGFNSTKRTTQYRETQAIARSNFATETIVTTTKQHTNGDAIASMGQASATPNDQGSKTTQVSEYTPKAVDSGWITWTSVEDAPTHTYTYECGIRVFKNLSALPTPPGGKRVQVSPNINRYGLYDGAMTYSQLVSWVQKTGTGGAYGGIQTGLIKYRYMSDVTVSTDSGGKVTFTPQFQTERLNTVTYYGRGNEGSEAAAAANAQSLPGLSLHGRTYLTSDVTATVEAMQRAQLKLQEARINARPAGT